ncbi:hypothetical protein GGR16_005092 [Chelatococcus caeni]|uniref:Uncharacterized protein n=1 Tax=Chelatococcus caeni TaxID=1348468 RepID=A0A840C4L0_9HYPH|nr:hypothetical protein [Chelatococcus caeni]MBB4020030.1 hypothetical protein [Chelatococcus caeni]
MLAFRLKKLEDRTAKATTANRVVFVDQLSGRMLSKIPSGVGVMIVPTWGEDAQWEEALREQQIKLVSEAREKERALP